MSSEKNEQDRREMIRQLEEEEARLNAEEAQLDERLTKAKRDHISVKAALVRAYNAPLSDGVCLACWINHGNKVQLYAVPSDDPARYDRWKCGVCENTEDRRTGMR